MITVFVWLVILTLFNLILFKKLNMYKVSGLAEIYNLTASEKMVFKLLLEGKNYTIIAEILDSNSTTVRKHGSNIYKKLGVKNIEELRSLISKSS